MKNKLIEIDSCTVGILIESKKFGTHTVCIDKEDLPRVSVFSWMLCPHKHSMYAKATCFAGGISMHRLIMSFPDGQVIDHADKCGLNNRKSNLSICSYSENSMRRKKSNRGSIYKGVYAGRLFNGFKSSIRCNGKFIHLGYFNTEIEAAVAYNNGAKKYFGEYAEINIFT
jgi:hypothetical protein